MDTTYAVDSRGAKLGLLRDAVMLLSGGSRFASWGPQERYQFPSQHMNSTTVASAPSSWRLYLVMLDDRCRGLTYALMYFELTEEELSLPLNVSL